MLESEESSFETDLWQLGITLFMMQTGKAPFAGATGMEMLIAGLVQYPQGVNVPQNGRNLIGELLKAKPSQRMGAGSYE
jgi:serine/threonine protein kinase